MGEKNWEKREKEGDLSQLESWNQLSISFGDSNRIRQWFFFPQVGGSSRRLAEMQSEFKKLQAVLPSSDPAPEAEVQAGRWKQKWRLMYKHRKWK